MYPYDEDYNIHANRFAGFLKRTVDDIRENGYISNELDFVKSYADIRFNWDRREVEWKTLMDGLIALKEQGKLKNRDEGMFVYRT
jgi:hypothetical protein